MLTGSKSLCVKPSQQRLQIAFLVPEDFYDDGGFKPTRRRCLPRSSQYVLKIGNAFSFCLFVYERNDVCVHRCRLSTTWSVSASR